MASEKMNVVWFVALWDKGNFQTIMEAFRCRKEAYDYIEERINEDLEKGYEGFTYSVYERSVR